MNIPGLGKHRQHLAIGLSALMLVAVFVPFQRADAVGVNFDFDGQTLVHSGQGSQIEITITLAPGEILESNTPIPVVITPGNPSVFNFEGTINLADERFDNTGPSTPGNLLNNISVTPDPTSVPSGYVYTYSFVDGWIGPQTITVTATLRTAPLTAGAGNTASQSLTMTVNGTPFTANFEVLQRGGGGGGIGGGGGGGGGGNRGQSAVQTTFPSSYFELNPLAKILVRNTAFINAAGNGVFQATAGEQISIQSLFKNQQETSQNYAFIVQVVDENGFTTDVSWQQGIVESDKTVTLSLSWMPTEPGTYTVHVFVWDGISDLPAPLSEVSVSKLKVTAG